MKTLATTGMPTAAARTRRLSDSGPKKRRKAGDEPLPAVVIAALRTSGRPLDAAIQANVRARFGFDFDRVRVHADGVAAAAADALDAIAFTCGQDIFFSAGCYRPHHEEGFRLLAHELAHTIQQRGSSPASHIDRPQLADDEALEREAEDASQQVASGQSLSPGALTIGSPLVRGRIACLVKRPATLPAEQAATPVLTDAIVNRIRAALKSDPNDRAGQLRRQFQQLAPAVRGAVLTQLRATTAADQWERLERLLVSEVPEPQQGDEAPLAAAPPAAEAGASAAAERQVAERQAEEAGAAEATVQPPERAEAPAEPLPLPATPESMAAEAEAQAVAETPAETMAIAVATGGEAERSPAAVPALPARGAKPAAAAAAPPIAVAAGGAVEESSPTPVPLEEPAEELRPAAERRQQPEDAQQVETAEQEPELRTAAPAAEAVAVPSVELPEESTAEAAPEAPALSEAAHSEAAEFRAAEPKASAEPSFEPTFEPQSPQLESAAAGIVESTAESDVGAATAPVALAATSAEAVEAVEPFGPSAAEPVLNDSATSDLADGGYGGAEPAAGGGGGGAAIPEPTPVTAPDVSQQDPALAVATVASLPPAPMVEAFAGLTASVNSSVAQHREALAANPPTVETPPPFPEGELLPAPAAPLTTEVERVESPASAAMPTPEPLPAPTPLPTTETSGPRVGGDPQGQLTARDVEAIQTSVRRLPTTDPELALTAGPAPTLELSGDADPALVGQQRHETNVAVADAHQQAARDTAAPMGEGDIYANVPQQTLTAQVPVGATAAGGEGLAAEVPSEAVAAVAEQEHGDEIRSAGQTAAGDVAARQSAHADNAAEEEQNTREQVAEASRAAAEEQDQERGAAIRQVTARRREWTTEQGNLVRRGNADSDTATREGTQRVERAHTDAEVQAERRIEEGEREAGQHRQEAERQATSERATAQQESSGVLGWLADRARAFFDRVKRAISAVFERFRQLIRAAIAGAKRLAAAAIEAGRRAVVGAIRWVGDRLIEIGDHVLAGFPELRDRFRSAINTAVDGATAAVNFIAENLNRGIQALLDAYGAILDAALGLLERGLLAVVDAYAAAIQGAIRAAEAAVQLAGVFAAIIGDIAAGPGQWISNLAAAVVGGIRNHLWREFKEAVKTWFNQKVEEVLGLGLAVWNLLRQGGLNLAQIGGMAWEGIKAAIPTVLIQLLIEKLVSMIVPAAGAILAIVEGLQAAWGTISRVFQAMERFVAFLQAVRGGAAERPFAVALAAAAIVVIDFVANWLLRRLVRPARGVAGRLRGIAQRIMARLRRVAQRIGRGVRRVARRIRRAARRLARRLGRTRLGRRVRASYRRQRARYQQRRERRRQQREQRRQQRRDRAIRETTAAVRRMLDGDGTSTLVFRARLFYLKARWGWKSLSLETARDGYRVSGVINPVVTLDPGNIIHTYLDVISASEIELADKKQTASFVEGSEIELADKKQTAWFVEGTERHVSPERAAQFSVAGLYEPRHGQPRGIPRHYQIFEEAAREQFARVVLPREQSLLGPGGRLLLSRPRMVTDSTEFSPAGAPRAGYVIPEWLATSPSDRPGPAMISLMEATLEADWRCVIRASRTTRKRGQYVQYLNAVKRRAHNLQEQNAKISSVQIHIHYYTAVPLKAEMRKELEDGIRSANIPNLTVIWHRV